MFEWNPLQNISDNEKVKIFAKQNQDTYNKLFYVSIIFACVGFIYLVTDLSTGYYNNPFGYLDMTAVLLMLLSSSAIVLLMVFLKEKLLDYIQIIASSYYLIINTVIALFLTVDLLTDKKDFLIVFYNLVLINLIIYFNVIFSLATEALTLIGVLAIVIVFTKTNRVITIEQTTLIVLGTMITQHYLRINKTKRFLKEISLEQLSKEFQESSTVDFLTTLYNRKGLDMFINDELTNSINSKENISVSMLDIDDFKSYNDYYSHMTGDLCLKKIGLCLNNVATGKFHAFRYGGEEFLVIGLDCTVRELDKLNANILNGIRDLKIDRSNVPNVADHITVSIGSAIAKLDSIDDFKELLQVADDRLYISKSKGKNRVTTSDQ